MAIYFGTSGWRAVLSEEFTFANVRRLASAIAGHVKEHPEYGVRGKEYRASIDKSPDGDTPVVLIGYDPRFMGEQFAAETALALATCGVRTAGLLRVIGYDRFGQPQ